MAGLQRSLGLKKAGEREWEWAGAGYNRSFNGSVAGSLVGSLGESASGRSRASWVSGRGMDLWSIELTGMGSTRTHENLGHQPGSLCRTLTPQTSLKLGRKKMANYGKDL